MIVVCTCGQKLRIKQLKTIDEARCPKCRTMLGKEAHRQAERNSAIVLEIAAVLHAKPESTWTKEEEVIARIFHAHER
jgi:uncharacterized paraquat-inducible protein A